MPMGRVVPYPGKSRHDPNQKPEEHLPEEIGSKEKEGHASATEGGANVMEEGAMLAGGTRAKAPADEWVVGTLNVRTLAFKSINGKAII